VIGFPHTDEVPLSREKEKLGLRPSGPTSSEPVSLSTILRSLGCERDTLHRYFPELCQAIVTRYQERFGYEQIRQHLQDTIISGRVTSVTEIARNLGCRPSSLFTLYPDLCKQIVERRRVALKRQHEHRVENPTRCATRWCR
jgi:AraC-like DNA-binding protein